jgi:heme-degrading monooxygenase HmoA
MYLTLYQWKVKPGKESQFIQAWARLTEHLQLKTPSLSGSLHKTIQGSYVALIEWPSQKDWEHQSSVSIDLSLQKEMMETVEDIEALFAMERVKTITAKS